MQAQVKPLGGSGVKNKQVAQTNLTGNFSGGRTVAGGGRESNQFSMGKLLGGVAVKGADEFVSGLTSTAAWLESATLGKLFPGTTEYSPIQGINERVQQAKVHNREYTAPNVKAGGKAAEIVDKYGTAVVAAVPQAGLAAMSGGTSAAAQGTTASLQAASSAAQAGTRFLPTVNSAFSSMAKDPQYWISFSQTAGNNYEQAKADGASDAKASLYALGNGLMTAAVEVGGGIQKLPGELQKGTKWFRAWTDTMLDEGKEEVVQGVLERGLQNLIYRKDNPLFSAKDESAILNPRTGVEDFLGGTIVGGILGGGQVSVNSAGNAVQGAAQGQNKTAPVSTGAEYRAERPQNVEYPTVPIINLSMQDVADLNGGVMPQTGNYVRKAATEQTEKRLGLDKNPAIYIEASNVTRNGDSYVIKITKPSLKKMLSASSYASGVVPLESVAVLNQIERIAQNGVYFKSEGDRYGRSQIAGYDHLMTTVYIDDIPFVVDMRVRVSDQKTDNGNTLYHFTPEAIEITKKNDSDISTTGRHAPSIKSETPLSSDTTVPQAAPGVKNEYTPELGVQTGAAAKPTLAEQITTMQKQLADMQFRKRVDELAAVYEKNVGSVKGSDNFDEPALNVYEGNINSIREAKVGVPIHKSTIDFLDENAVIKELDAARDEFAEFDHEESLTVTSDGKVWRVKGEERRVDPASIQDAGSDLKGSYSYHNHPAKETNYSFSAADVQFFFEYGENYSKAADDRFEYIMIRTPETLDIDSVAAYNRFEELYKTKIYKLSWEGKIDIDLDGFHEVMKMLSQEYGFIYERRERSGAE